MVTANIAPIAVTKIIPDIINVGGGFPSIYPDLNPQPLENYIQEIKKAFNNLFTRIFSLFEKFYYIYRRKFK